MTVTTITHMHNTEKHSGMSGLPTQLLVVHSGECPLRGGYAQSLTQWANIPLNQGGPEASWHWFADPIAIVSMVDPMLAAWHASEANPMSEGFEQAGYARFTRAEWMTEDGQKSIDNLAWILVQRMKANDIPHRWLTTDEVEAVTKRGNRSIKGLCLHRQVDPETRYDPGNNYPFDYLDERIRVHLGTTVEKEEDDMANPSPETIQAIAAAVWGFSNPELDPRDMRQLLSDVETQTKSVPLAVWAFQNPSLDPRDMRQIISDAAGDVDELIDRPSVADIAESLNAAGIAAEVRDELIKLLGGTVKEAGA